MASLSEGGHKAREQGSDIVLMLADRLNRHHTRNTVGGCHNLVLMLLKMKMTNQFLHYFFAGTSTHFLLHEVAYLVWIHSVSPEHFNMLRLVAEMRLEGEGSDQRLFWTWNGEGGLEYC